MTTETGAELTRITEEIDVGQPGLVPVVAVQTQSPIEVKQYVKYLRKNANGKTDVVVSPVLDGPRDLAYKQVLDPRTQKMVLHEVPKDYTGKIVEIYVDEPDVPSDNEDQYKLGERSEGKKFYDTNEDVDSCYFCIRWLWCGCCEDSQLVTSTIAEMTYCNGCGLITDARPMDTFADARLDQGCCLKCMNCFGCGCNDMGDIQLYGSGESVMWTMRKVHNSHDVFETINKQINKNKDMHKKR